MTPAYWSMDWIARFRQMDLDEVMKIQSDATQVISEKQRETYQRLRKE